MTITIHQPEHLIWLGLVDKISKSDIFVILDNVQYRKNYFQNRNKIKTKKGWRWLTVPIKKHPFETKVNAIEISDQNWQEHYLSILKENYEKAPYFERYFGGIREIIYRDHKFISDLNTELIAFLLNEFQIKKKILKASSLRLQDLKGGSNINLTICEKLKADSYLSGPSGEDYLDLAQFKKHKIDVSFHKFDHPAYRQLWGEFIPCMSSIDLLFNYGPKAKAILFE